MCLIIVSPKGHLPTREHVENALDHNSDGVGIMSRRGVEKHLSTNADALYAILEELMDEDFAIHFRFATHGLRNHANTHPYRLANGGWLMHNGILNCGNASDRDKSDTWQYVHEVINPYMSVVEEEEDLWEWVAQDITASNKFAVMDPNGGIRIVNESSGSWIKGGWYSNRYSITTPYYEKWDPVYRSAPYEPNDDPSLVMNVQLLMGELLKRFPREADRDQFGEVVTDDDLWFMDLPDLIGYVGAVADRLYGDTAAPTSDAPQYPPAKTKSRDSDARHTKTRRKAKPRKAENIFIVGGSKRPDWDNESVGVWGEKVFERRMEEGPDPYGDS